MATPVMASATWCLREINALPLPLDLDLFCNYPGMKLGQLHQVEFFSQKLFGLASELLKSDAQDWVITAPAFYHLPSAANLLARRVHALLQQQGYAIPLLEPRFTQEQIAFTDQNDFNISTNYAQGNLQQRIAERQRLHEKQQFNIIEQQFAQRRVLIINDIYVTGTQQRFMQQSLSQWGAISCDWLYIFKLASTLAEQHPETEFQINNSQFADLDSYVRILADPHIAHTRICITRLFKLKPDDFRYVLAALDQAARQRLYQNVQQESCFNIALFNDQMRLLASQGIQSLGAH
jgi:PRTase ComF-like